MGPTVPLASARLEGVDVTWFVDRLRSRDDCVCEDGLSDLELDRAQARVSLRFSSLWCAVLRAVHPVSVPFGHRHQHPASRRTQFPDWRLRDVAGLTDMVAAPLEGVLHDVEANGFWWHEWGEPPDSGAERLAIARSRALSIPLLMPLWDHWYASGDDLSPVFNIVRTEVYTPAASVAGLVLGDDPRAAHPVPFWSDLHRAPKPGAP
jgi:hypothetical protein